MTDNNYGCSKVPALIQPNSASHHCCITTTAARKCLHQFPIRCPFLQRQLQLQSSRWPSKSQHPSGPRSLHQFLHPLIIHLSLPQSAPYQSVPSSRLPLSLPPPIPPSAVHPFSSSLLPQSVLPSAYPSPSRPLIQEADAKRVKPWLTSRFCAS